MPKGFESRDEPGRLSPTRDSPWMMKKGFSVGSDEHEREETPLGIWMIPARTTSPSCSQIRVA